jgi:hypothetical protein
MTELIMSRALLRMLPVVVNTDPVWFASSDHDLTALLADLPASIVVEAARKLPSPYVCKRHACESAVASLLSHYSHLRSQMSSLADADLYSLCLPALQSPCSSISLYTVIFCYLDLLYGRAVVSALHRPPKLLIDYVKPQPVNQNCTQSPDPSSSEGNIVDCLNWRHLPLEVLNACLNKLTKVDLMTCIQSIPISLHPVTQRLSQRKCCAAIVQHVQKQLWYLDSLDDYLFLVTVLSVIPFVILSSRDGMIKDMLIAEYSMLLMNHLQQPLPTLRQKQLDARRSVKEMLAAQTVQDRAEISSHWPTVVPCSVALDCLRNYRHAMCWEPGNVCAVCSHCCHDTRVCDIEPDPQNSALPMHLDILLLKDLFILRNCVVHCMSSKFVYDTPWLNGVMLAKAEVTTHTNVRASLNVCSDCFHP